METKNVMIVGVGGQGSLLASKLLGHLLCEEGYDVKVSEVHGMSQRGGSVVTYVRYGDRVDSPIIDKGEADYIVSFELLEAARWTEFLKPEGKIIVNTQQINPMPVIIGAAQYPENLVQKMLDAGIDVDALDALTLAEQAGSTKAVNIVLMGHLSRNFDFTEEEPEEPVDPEEPSIKVGVSAAKVNYDRAGEKQILFTAGDQSHQFNFKHSEIVVSKPIPDGTYSTAEGTMTERYCKHDIDFTYGDMTNVTVKITNNSDSTTRFVARWTFEGEAYSFDWTGAVEGYTYEDVSGQRLDFTPTHVEVSDAGFAGLYFYFYDARENELVLNYDRNKVYMPYINYEGTKLDIDSTDYTFEFSDNGDGTYTYNARFVTLDGRIIEFASTLPTTVS